MKKVLAAVLLVLMCACAAIGMTACGEGKVEGNTYVYDSIEYKGEFSEQEKQQMETMYGKMEIAFKDGTVTTYLDGVAQGKPVSYEQKGDKIVMNGGNGGPQDITVKGGKIVMSTTIQDRSVVLTLKKK